MRIFTRMRDIVSSNLNAMLDKAEDPAKLIRLMIQEMEDTLIDIKAQCAASMAQSKTFSRQVEDVRDRVAQWAEKAKQAVEKGRDALAKEALLEKRRWQDRVDPLERQLTECDHLIDQYQNDIAQLDSKIQSVRERQKVLLQRQAHAQSKRKAECNIRTASSDDVLRKFEAFERKIDHLEAEAKLVNYGAGPAAEQEFEKALVDEELEEELEAIRKNLKSGNKK